ncbi:concanavalin A-like lectin/glucanase domain-containing protein [Xylogone sp. PMI_703]|nr:concanavalin A-like lectin/glucanase domain-containing protein [Xylogone sp. PMI_703]
MPSFNTLPALIFLSGIRWGNAWSFFSGEGLVLLCYSAYGVSARSLPSSSSLSVVPSQMAVELCQSICLMAGYSLVGFDYAGECSSADFSSPTSSYSLRHNYTASNFFSEWRFFTDADPTHGFVDYVDQSFAQASGLVNTDNHQIYMGVDNETMDPSSGRKSVRVFSKTTFTHGLFIADVQHMPTGCGTWPAWWMAGPNWPNNGEIDVIEGVNSGDTNSITLHTSAGCNITTTGSQAGSELATPNCNSNNAFGGCGISTNNTQNYGSGFNAIGGGVYAMQWTSSAIKTWFFPRSSIPPDITVDHPNPSGWGAPIALFNGGVGCNIDSHFANLAIIFDTTFCGDWAGSVWNVGSCGSLASSCEAYVAANPHAFNDAYWSINSVKVYQ